MKKNNIFLITILIICSCQKNNKKDTTILEKSNTSFVQKNINCDSIWKSWSQLQSKKDSIIQKIINQNKKSLSFENISLLYALKENKDSLLKFKQPLSAVFKDLAPEPFIISNYQWKKIGEGYINYYPESKLLNKVETNDSNEFLGESRKYYKNILNKVNKNEREIFVIGQNKTSTALVTILGKQNSECEPYVFYNFITANKYSITNPLVVSPYNINVEFGNWSNIDSLIKDNIINKCSDCLNSYDKNKTFAKLKGTKNVFFSFNNPTPNRDDSYTPSRSLFYITEDNKIVNLWSDSIDLFGCSCL
ncbi:hypothetical protein [Polaribacter gochangensis]|uniref:hypothetical protein n=1 Tax=Polaribacter gochangensis TaxID=3252903 RepID=UPI003904A1E4